MEKQLRIDGSVDLPSDEVPLERNANGSVPAAHLKAVAWYTAEHGLKLVGSSAWPNYVFLGRDGQEVTVHLYDILDEYGKNKRTGSKQAGA